LYVHKEFFPWGKLFPVVLRDSWGLLRIAGGTPTYPDESGRAPSPKGGILIKNLINRPTRHAILRGRLYKLSNSMNFQDIVL